jgi:hypothetical protein
LRLWGFLGPGAAIEYLGCDTTPTTTIFRHGRPIYTCLFTWRGLVDDRLYESISYSDLLPF